jgi:predicted Zn-dependent protease
MADACGYDVYVQDSPEVNASADGKEIFVMRGVVEFVENDSELALVIAHELAHNTMGHLVKQSQNRAIGMLAGATLDVAAAAAHANTQGYFTKLGAKVGGGAYSQEFEAEADYVGMYYMARAGYPMAGVEGFWRRMAAENPKQITMGLDHPSSAARFVAIAETRAEIEAKQRASLPLEPNLKSHPADKDAPDPKL